MRLEGEEGIAHGCVTSVAVRQGSHRRDTRADQARVKESSEENSGRVARVGRQRHGTALPKRRTPAPAPMVATPTSTFLISSDAVPSFTGSSSFDQLLSISIGQVRNHPHIFRAFHSAEMKKMNSVWTWNVGPCTRRCVYIAAAATRARRGVLWLSWVSLGAITSGDSGRQRERTSRCPRRTSADLLLAVMARATRRCSQLRVTMERRARRVRFAVNKKKKSSTWWDLHPTRLV